MSEREEKFERMMQAVLDSYNSVVEKMDKLKQEGKTNTVRNYWKAPGFHLLQSTPLRRITLLTS